MDPLPQELLEKARECKGRLMLVGASGTGKSTLARALGIALAEPGGEVYCLNTDPSAPAFGPPGAIALGRMHQDDWSLLRLEPLCSLDAVRFRLPLVAAARRLLAHCSKGLLILDTPGVVSGVAGAELIPALAEVAGIDLCVVLVPEGGSVPIADELTGIDAEVFHLTASPRARAGTRSSRGRRRTELWHEHMSQAQARTIRPGSFKLLGTPPPLANEQAWEGRQIALLRDGECVAMGEVLEKTSPSEWRALLSGDTQEANQLLTRDAIHRDGKLRTARKQSASPRTTRNNGLSPGANEVKVELGALTSTATEPQVAVPVGDVTASLVNGAGGDALLQVRIKHQARSLLFDIGDAGRMPLRAAHQITDLFISHAHADHISGFIWLVRCRIGHYPPCRVFGPVGLTKQLLGMMNGILWDRVEDRSPVFEVHEWHGTHLERWRIQAGEDHPTPLNPLPISDGIIHREPGFLIRATELDHRTPVLAYAFEPRRKLKVRRDKLGALNVSPGPWLQQLKQAYTASRWEERIPLGDGREPTVDELAEALLLAEPGDTLVYATDFRESPENIEKVTRLARGAHTLFCESTFMLSEQEQAKRTQHLTTQTCAQIANNADVRQLVTFHFSHRYDNRRWQLYEELQRFTDKVLIPNQHPHST